MAGVAVASNAASEWASHTPRAVAGRNVSTKLTARKARMRHRAAGKVAVKKRPNDRHVRGRVPYRTAPAPATNCERRRFRPGSLKYVWAYDRWLDVRW